MRRVVVGVICRCYDWRDSTCKGEQWQIVSACGSGGGSCGPEFGDTSVLHGHDLVGSSHESGFISDN